MKIVQSISGDKSFVDFAITKDQKTADIYSVSSSVLKREDLKEKLDKYVTLTESEIPWNKIKTETGEQKVENELFDLISAFLTGSTRGRSDSTFEEPEPKRQRMEITLSIDTGLANDEQYADLISDIQNRQQQRMDKFDEWVRGWEAMTPEEIDELNRRYEMEMLQEAEQQFADDPDYEPESSDEDDSGGSSDSTTDYEDAEFSETLSDSDSDSGSDKK